MLLRLFLLGCGLVLSGAIAQAQAPYPNKPITFVVPYPAGGATDIIARLVGEKLRERLGQQVIIDNRAGAAGSIGTTAVFRAEPDGYTLLVASNAPVLTYPLTTKDVRYDPAKFVAIAELATAPLVLAAGKALPVKSVKELVDYAKANPGKLNYGSSGVGTGNHLTIEALQQATGTKMVHVPYPGEAQVTQAIQSGQLHFAMSGMLPVLPFHKSGDMRILAVGSAERVPELPDVPTFAEAGVAAVPVVTTSLIMMAPPGTPDSIADILNKAVNDVLKQPATAEQIVKLGMAPVGGTGKALADYYDKQRPAWAKVIKDAGLAPQ